MTKKKSNSKSKGKSKSNSAKISRKTRAFSALKKTPSKVIDIGIKGAEGIIHVVDEPKTWEYIVLIIFIPLIVIIVSCIFYIWLEHNKKPHNPTIATTPNRDDQEDNREDNEIIINNN